jgi:hypothetical protein
LKFRFRISSKFALLAVQGVGAELPDTEFQLSDGTWIMPRVPVADLGIWKDWIGSIRTERLSQANLVLLSEEGSDSPEILDAVHHRLDNDLSRLFYFFHLRQGVECFGADLLCGSAEQSVPRIRQMSQLPTFHQSKGYRRASITTEWLEEAVSLRAGVVAVDADMSEFRRVIRGLNVLFNGLKETGQNRMHQFVRSLEALILPDIGNTKKQFVHRCQTFARTGDDTRSILQEAFDMRSDTEHLHDWNRAVKIYAPAEQEDVCWQRTRQIERLACVAYSPVLREATIREHFRTESAMAAFWKLADDKRRSIWGDPTDIAAEPRFAKYDQRQRGLA